MEKWWGVGGTMTSDMCIKSIQVVDTMRSWNYTLHIKVSHDRRGTCQWSWKLPLRLRNGCGTCHYTHIYIYINRTLPRQFYSESITSTTFVHIHASRGRESCLSFTSMTVVELPPGNL